MTSTAIAGGKDKSTVYQFKVPALSGGTIDFAQFKGKKILIVNTASECGYTQQYEGLEKLYQRYKDKLVVVGFPANDFGGQEPGSNNDIASFCKSKYGVSFPMAAKVVILGKKQDAIYKWLTHKKQNGVQDAEVKWNFHKFLIDEKGHLQAVFPSAAKPEGPELKAALEQ